MSFKALQRSILAGMLAGGMAATALPQIPVPPPPPLPGLDVRITTRRPPVPRHERRGPRPGRDYVWVGGFWHWDGGRWSWVAGRWDRPVTPESYWVTPRYVRSSRGYIYEPGHWSSQRVVISQEIRQRPEWRRHEREHERELERERDRNRHRDRDRDSDER